MQQGVWAVYITPPIWSMHDEFGQLQPLETRTLGIGENRFSFKSFRLHITKHELLFFNPEVSYEILGN